MIQVKRYLVLLLIVQFFCVSILQSGIANALSDEQKSIYKSGINYFDLEVCGAPEPDDSENTGGGPVYMMGDSITAGAKANLQKEFEANDISVTNIDGVGSRSFISKGDGDTNGLEAIDAGETDIKSAKSVIIALGTNGEDANGKSSTFKNNAKTAIDNIKGFNPEVKIYWVNLFTTSSTIKHKAAYNKVIEDLPGVDVIDADGEKISLDDGIHPDTAGYKKYAKFVAGEVKTSGISPIKVGNIPASGKMVGGSVFTDAQGYRDASILNTYSYAELSPPGTASNEVTQRTANNMGGLKYKQKLAITYKGKTVVAERLDIGKGGGDVKGKSRDIDIYFDKTLKALGVNDSQTWTDVVKVQGVPDNTPLGPVTGTSVSKVTAASSSLSLREKIGQLMFVGTTNNKSEMVTLIKKYKLGGVMLNSGSTSLFSKSAISDLKDASGELPLLVASDEEGGKVQRLKSETGEYPSAKTLGKQSADSIKSSAESYGKKLSDLGVTVNFAPVLDIDDGSNSIISDKGRAFSSDPETIADKAGAFAKGMRNASVTPVFKHFPGHGRADGDSHTEKVTTPHISSLKNKDLKPYESLLKQGTSGVMVGHLIVPGLTEGRQATLSSKAIDLLRGGDYDFNGVVFSDELANMKAIGDQYSPAEAVSLSIQAGIDMPLFNESSRYSSFDNQIDKTIDKIEKDVNSGKIDKTQIDASLRRISELKGVSPPATAKSSAACTCEADGSTGVSNLSGSNNIEKVYNYLISKGLSPKQAAGITGNLMWESGGGGKDIPTNISNPDSGAYGIAQWLGGRQTALKALAVKENKKVTDLQLQLDYLWYELSDPNSAEKKQFNVLEEIKKMDDLTQVVIHWEEEFERSEDVVGSHGMNERIRFAKQVFKKFGGASNALGDAETTANACPETEGSGESKGDFIWPVPKIHPVTSCWGEFRQKYNNGAGGGHSGLDIGAPQGVPIKASDGGTVELAKKQAGGFGNVVVIKHEGGKWSLYAHMVEIKTTQGKKVDQGDVIGLVGSTGISFGTHLHFNIQTKPGEVSPAENGTLNPLDFLPNDGRNLNGCKAGKKG